MSFWQRLRFYLVGFIPGCIILVFIIQKKGCTSPNELKMQELTYQSFQFSPKAACKVKCLGFTEKGFKVELHNYRVNYDLSNVHKDPYGEFYLQAKENIQPRFELLVVDHDTITQVNDIKIIDPKVTCKCDSL